MNLTSLSKPYNRQDVLDDLSKFLTSTFEEKNQNLPLVGTKYDSITKASFLGKSSLFSVFEIQHCKSSDARVTLTKQAVSLMEKNKLSRALFFFVPEDKKTFRISLVTVDWAHNKQASNPRRYSFLVGEGQKVHTAIKQLSSAIINEEDLLKRFSIEVVNDEFYKKISEHFEDLLKTIKYPSVCQQEKQEEAKRNFAVRLIGRLIFCWFLKKKIRQDGSALIPEDLLSSKVVEKYENYYHEILEPLFFETLNKQSQNRIQKCRTGLFAHIPFLNGGLFEAHDPEDGYKYDEKTEMCYLGMAITIPNAWFIKFFETLETYNFTIDENTSTDIDLAVDPEMLGRIFENLLASINPETKESVRKATGSYYTPREIVDYMVTQSLKQYLYTKTDVDHKVIDSLFEFDPKVDEKTLPLTQKQQIYTSLSEIKVLDPAVGSGAFPMGVLQKIMAIIHIIDPVGDIYRSLPETNTTISQNLTSKTLDYVNKLTLIQKCIYGVDIQPMAIEICRLRFFLTLIVEEESDEPKPLPNLNFNFACANSLVALDNNNILELKQKRETLLKSIKEKETEISLLLKGENIFELPQKKKEKINVIKKELDKFNKEKDIIKKQFEKADINTFLNGENYIAQLRACRKKFFAASGENKESLKKEFIETQDRMLEALQANDWGNEKIIKLQAWKPFENNSTGWFDPMWMFGVEDGFDIVIANPPYIPYKKISKQYDLTCFKSFHNNQVNKPNLYVYFIEEGLEHLLTTNGTLVFINPISFLVQSDSSSVRELILKKRINEILDLSYIDVFKTADTYTGIFNITNTSSNENIEWQRYENTKELYRKRKIVCPFSQLIQGKDKKIVLSPNIQLLNKIQRQKNCIGQIADIICGTSAEGFGKKISFTQTNSNVPVLQSSDILKYRINWNPQYIEKDLFKTNKIQNFFIPTKIVMARMTDTIRCAIDTKGFYCAKINVIVAKDKTTQTLKIILGLLNSKLLDFFYQETYRSLHKKGGALGFDIPSIEQLPIPNQSQLKNLLPIVNKLLIAQSSNNITDVYQNEIDQLVYKLYGLTEEEIKIVEESQPKKK